METQGIDEMEVINEISKTVINVYKVVSDKLMKLNANVKSILKINNVKNDLIAILKFQII